MAENIGVFIIHARNWADYQKRIPHAIPFKPQIARWVERRTLNLRGRMGITRCSTFQIDENSVGHLIGTMLTSEQIKDMMKRPNREGLKYFRSRVMDVVSYGVEKLGATNFGLGALTSPFTDDGNYVADQLAKLGLSRIGVTNGDQYSGYSAYLATVKAAKLRGINLPKSTIAVLGAGGVVGRLAAILNAESCQPREMILTGSKGRTKKVHDIATEMRARGYYGDIHVTDKNEDASTADIVIACTTGDGTIITPEILKENAVVIDMAQPLNMSFETALKRPDVLRIDGGFMMAPGINYHFNIPPFACFVDTIIRTMQGDRGNYVGRKLDVDQSIEFGKKAVSMGFGLAPFTSFGRPIIRTDDIYRVEPASVALAKQGWATKFTSLFF